MKRIFMIKYILNIKTRVIRNIITPCAQCKKTAGNKKHFKIYEKAINFFEGTTTTEKPYGICMKYKDEQDITR